jgi:hypothetical protein
MHQSVMHKALCVMWSEGVNCEVRCGARV